MSKHVNNRRRIIRGHAVAMVCGVGVVLSGTLAEAKSPIACGTFHSIERGDTLFRLAVRAYDDGWKYKRIFAANRDLLPDEQSVEIGDQIFIPCLGGIGPATRREALAKAEPPAEPLAPAVETAESAPLQPAPEAEPATVAAEERPAERSDTQSGPIEGLRRGVASLILSASLGGSAIVDPLAPASGPEAAPQSDMAGDTISPPLRQGPARLLTGSGLAPFTGESLREGGMITELVTRAIQHSSPGQAMQVAYVDNWDAHLGGLLATGALDLGFPWVKPDCSAVARLSPQAQRLCADFAFSRPLFELPMAAYVLPDGPAASATRRICQTAAPYPFDAGAATVTEAIPAACFVRLLRREVDMVVLPRRDGEALIRRHALVNQVEEVKTLAATRTLHAVVSRSSPEGLAFLAMIDAGLDRMMASGEWFRIVAVHQSNVLALAE